MMHVDAQNLRFGDQVLFEGETYNVIEAVPNNIGSINVLLSPTDGISLDRHLAFPKQFYFDTLYRLL